MFSASKRTARVGSRWICGFWQAGSLCGSALHFRALQHGATGGFWRIPVTTGYGWALLTKVLIAPFGGIVWLIQSLFAPTRIANRLAPWLSKRIPPAWRMGGRLPAFCHRSPSGRAHSGHQQLAQCIRAPKLNRLHHRSNHHSPTVGQTCGWVVGDALSQTQSSAITSSPFGRWAIAESQRVLRTVLNFHYQGENAQVLEPGYDDCRRGGNRVFQAAGNHSSLPGPWQVEVRMVRADGSEQAIKFDCGTAF